MHSYIIITVTQIPSCPEILYTHTHAYIKKHIQTHIYAMNEHPILFLSEKFLYPNFILNYVKKITTMFMFIN